MMNRAETSDSIPIDLLLEIFSRLPAKSILRFRCVSRLWRAILHRQYFTDLFFTRSSARPRILFAIQTRAGDNEWNFFSSPQPQNPYETSSLVASADFCLKLPKGMLLGFGMLASVLVHSSKQEGEDQMMHMVFNPSTGRFRILPYHKMHVSSFLGFDPIDKQYKVLCINTNPYEDRHDCGILTLEHGEMMWRKIHCPLIHDPWCKWVCIDGVLYYFAGNDARLYAMIVCFDVRFEKFKFIDTICDWPTRLVNYKGKLGVIKHNHNCSFITERWVLEDIDKQKWSYDVNIWSQKEGIDVCYLSLAGVTSTGEMIFNFPSGRRLSFYVWYFNLERKILHHVEIQGVGEYLKEDKDRRVYVFGDYLEDLHFNIMRTKYAPISVRPLQKICRRPKSKSRSSKKDHH